MHSRPRLGCKGKTLKFSISKTDLLEALSIVSKGIEAYRASCDGALLIITHNTRILERLSVDRTHVMVKGNLVAEGDASLITDIDAHGFERFERALEGDAK